jgi:two-component system OmpR family sensor kinase
MLSLRAKLTLYYLAILSAVLIFFGFAIYWYLSRSLVASIDDSLAYQAAALEQRMEASTALEFLPDEQAGLNHESHIDQLLITPQIIQVIDAAGRITDETAPSSVHHLPVSLDALRRIAGGATHFETIALPSGEQFRLATRRAQDQEGDTYFIRVGQSLRPLQQARLRLILVLSIAIPAALLLGSYGGLLLANQALRPVDRITRAAEQIGAGDLSERVPLPEKTDELGRLAATFNRMIARLQAAFERQRQFTSAASHELRTPLAVMRGDIEITLRRPRPPEEYQRVLTSNLEEIVRLSRLVEDLLTLARADAAQSVLQCEPMALDQLCQQVIEYILPLAQTRRQTLTYQPPAAPVLIKGDAQRLKQLLLNLIDNALKYTGEEGRITLGLKAEGEEAVLTVADTGRGIPPGDLPHVFERFFRHSRTTSDKNISGFGLGLSIVKWIVDSHGGKIEVASKVGEGTTFTVRLPLLSA